VLPQTGDLAYRAARGRLVAQYRALPAGTSVRLAKPTSNLFRLRQPAAALLDVTGLDRVLHVDPVARTADVAGMTTYEDLVAATLPHGLMPAVVPELRTITLGGAVTGLGVEASSFRAGLPHESVRELEVLTGDGQVVVATAGGEHAALYAGFPNSYGTLGYALRLLVDLVPVQPFVRLRHEHFEDAAQYFAAMAATCADADATGVDFVDGVVFGPTSHVLTTGTFTDTAPYTSDYTGRQIYYRSLLGRRDDYLGVEEFLWRWDTDWFWCSRALGVQHPLVRPLVPRRLRRSDVYSRLVTFERRHGVVGRLTHPRGAPAREAVIQDVELAVGAAAEFLDFFHAEVGISPVWACPMRLARTDVTWSLYPLDPDTLYINLGFWSTVELPPGRADGHYNRLVEERVSALGGAKSLYSSSFYSAEDFWDRYNGPAYQVLKKTYDPDGRLLDLYDKCVRGR